jgi:hypothetical protein
MSNYQAIAAVTAALQQILQPPVANAVTHATVGFNRPDPTNTTAPLVNIYLYQVTPNAAYRNADLPTRRPDGSLAHRPQAALDLHYLFTFHGDDGKLEPQLLLGAVVTTLTAQPLLSTGAITAGGNHIGLTGAVTGISGSGLENQIERVKFTPMALSLEEFSKLWSAFFQVEYNLSVAYQASVVLMESRDIPQQAPPVLARKLYVVPFRSPAIDQVISQAGANQPITAVSTLLIQGQQLLAPNTFVLIENQEFQVTPASDTQITLPVPGSIHAGVKGVQVLQKVAMGLGSPAPLHRGVESNAAAFVLRPTIQPPTVGPAVPPATGTAVTFTVTPNIGVGQRAVMVLNPQPGSPLQGYISLPAVAAADSSQVTINVNDVPTGTYLVRLQIDGAESLLAFDSGTNQFTGPTVSMP